MHLDAQCEFEKARRTPSTVLPFVGISESGRQHRTGWQKGTGETLTEGKGTTYVARVCHVVWNDVRRVLIERWFKV